MTLLFKDEVSSGSSLLHDEGIAMQAFRRKPLLFFVYRRQ